MRERERETDRDREKDQREKDRERERPRERKTERETYRPEPCCCRREGWAAGRCSWSSTLSLPGSLQPGKPAEKDQTHVCLVTQISQFY